MCPTPARVILILDQSNCGKDWKEKKNDKQSRADYVEHIQFISLGITSIF
jgi:hypothetical protein